MKKLLDRIALILNGIWWIFVLIVTFLFAVLTFPIWVWKWAINRAAEIYRERKRLNVNNARNDN